MSSLILNGIAVNVVKVEKVIKLCRICLVEDVRMFAITDKNLQELFEKLADIPFVTEDHRPMLICFFCYAQLKQCCQLRRKCRQAEEWFTQMLNEDYELNLAVYRSQLRLSGGFTVSPVENISIDDGCRAESVAIKEEPAVSKTHNGVELIQLEEEPLIDEMELEEDSTDQSQKYSPPQESVSDSEDDVPLITMKIGKGEEEKIQEVSVKKKLAKNTKCSSLSKTQANISTRARANIVALRKNGLNISQISTETGLSRSTVSRWIKRFEEEGSLQSRVRSGRPPLIKPTQRSFMVKEYEKYGFVPTRVFADQFDISMRTVRRALHAEGINCRKPAKKPFLTQHKEE